MQTTQDLDIIMNNKSSSEDHSNSQFSDGFEISQMQQEYSENLKYSNQELDGLSEIQNKSQNLPEKDLSLPIHVATQYDPKEEQKSSQDDGSDQFLVNYVDDQESEVLTEKVQTNSDNAEDFMIEGDSKGNQIDSNGKSILFYILTINVMTSLRELKRSIFHIIIHAIW